MFSKEYLDWVKKEEIKNLTRNQSRISEWLLKPENPDFLIMIGSFDSIFSSVRHYAREKQKEFEESKKRKL